MRKRLILVVDDEPPIVRLVKTKLQLDGFTVVTAGKGEDALPVVERDRPDLVILDLMMPGMDGLETLRHIREKSRVPVIFRGELYATPALAGAAIASVLTYYDGPEVVAAFCGGTLCLVWRLVAIRRNWTAPLPRGPASV